ncbi:Interphotoreceptor retinol-binding [Penicillium waksmanii]|uniref:Interphotoreceptor retinol-binding n=1 Tax=Penicillium waksmanii TaxID=69791 RepID=UPI0025485849|nr:Interphotoreceptor retinol-binding [Penicillium waksmanii]KAJ5980492.1 Interphotoreceptor retinol-binding [Penicillium waksmanii]
MHLKTTLLAPVALGAAVGASRNVRDIDPCAQITSLVADANEKKVDTTVPHDLAYQCLKSMPFESDRATIFLTNVRKILEFQSTVDFLKSPPSGYKMPSVDLLGGIDTILDKAKGDGYSSQFEMDLETSNLIKSAHDSHLVFQLCSQSIFNYVIDFPLVSVSSDGLSLPAIYTLNDANVKEQNPKDVSPLVSINGTDAAKFLETYAFSQALQDRDAQYNRIFPASARSVTNTPIGVNGLWTSSTEWSEGSELTIEYGNGTKQTIEKKASPTERFFSYDNGTELYTVNCIPRTLNSAFSTSSTEEASSEVPGLPDTTWKNSAGSVAGYFSKLTGLEDTGILFLPTFSSSPSDVSRVTVEFLKNATEAGKKNILIDLTGNPGGSISIGLDLFKIFFPEETPYTATRYRAHDAAKYLTKAESSDPSADASNPFGYKKNVKPDQKTDFKSWDDLYGPHDTLGSSSSSLLANFNYTALSSTSFPINGYGSIALDPKKALFPGKNIAILTNGECASTCALFLKLMKRQGVRTIAFGGRPTESPMQGAGGVKGGQSLQINYINGYIQQANQAIQKAAGTSSPILSTSEWKRFNETSPNLTPSFSWSGNINLRNEYDPEDGETPLQFVYEAAECRRFYTLHNYLQQETTWQDAVNSMFGDAGCVKGSTNGEGSLDA